MTVSTQTTKIVYQGNGSTIQFTVPFRFVREADLRVIVCSEDGTENELTLTTDYVLSGAGQPTGGSCTLNQAPGAAETLTILRDPDLVQETDYQENDAFPAETHEAALDLLTMIAQANRERIERAVKLPVSSPLTDLVLSRPEAGRALVWNGDGDGLENGPTADEISNAQGYAVAAETAQGLAEAARDAAQAAQAVCQDLTDVDASEIGYDPALSGLVSETVQDAIDELAGETTALFGFAELSRDMELGFFQLAENQAMTEIELVNKRIDTFEDAANIDAINSSGYAHDDTYDLVTPLPGDASQEPDLSAATHEDVKGSITQLVVDTANTSGHFDAAAGAQVLAGCRMVISGADYPITAITDGGDAANEVEFDGTLATGTYTVTAIYGTEYVDSAIALALAYSGQAQIAQDEGTVIGDMTNSAGNAASFDGNKNVAQTSASASVNVKASCYIGKSWSTARTVTGVKTWGANNAGYSDNSMAVNMYLYGGDTAPASPGDGTLLGTIAESVPDTNLANPQEQMSGFDTSMPYLYHWVYLEPVSGSWQLRMAEVEFYEDDTAAPIGKFYPVALPAVDHAAIADIVSAAVTGDDAGETLVFAMSFDGGTTKVAWDGVDSWDAVTLDAETGWMTEAVIEAVADSDWPTPTGDIIVYAGFKTTTASANPSLSGFTLTVVGQVANMDLRLEPVATTDAPASARVFAVLKDVDTLTLNTDLKAWASRNDGADWDQITLAKVGDFLTDRYTVEGTSEGFTHADGGTDEAVFRFTSENHKDFELRFLSQGIGV